MAIRHQDFRRLEWPSVATQQLDADCHTSTKTSPTTHTIKLIGRDHTDGSRNIQ